VRAARPWWNQRLFRLGSRPRIRRRPARPLVEQPRTVKDSEPLKWYQFRLRSLLALMLVVQISCIVTLQSLRAFRRYQNYHNLRVLAQAALAERRGGILKYLNYGNAARNPPTNNARSQGDSPLDTTGRGKMVN